MKWSKAFIPTLKEDPKEAETPSHRLLLRAGFIRQHQSGVYIFLPLGWRSMLKIMEIVRQEMDAIGAQEVMLPALTSAKLWEESGRWEAFGDDMFRLQDRKGHDMALAPTHEEIMTDLARVYLRSYRDLPQIWYQMQTKFRDEPRPRAGILRVREFIMKDSYSFDATWEGLDKSYELHRVAYKKIFDRCGLKYTVVEASSGLMGGSQSEEFMVVSPSGEDRLAICENCGYSANVEVAEGEAAPAPESPFKKREKVYTPNVKSVEEVSGFLNVPPSLIVKSLLYIVGDRWVLVLIRGDHEVNETKLAKVLGGDARMATPDEVMAKFGMPVGFVGPIGIEVDEIVADKAVDGLKGAVVGANEEEHHIVGVDIGTDVKVSRYEDLRTVVSGDKCPKCGAPLKVVNAIEIGHIFKLGTKYSESMGAYFMDKDGKRKPIIMGSYGIGIGRIMAAAVELYHDEKGISWPMTIAPYEIDIIEIDPRKTSEIAEKIYKRLIENGIDVIWDDREATAGFKFKDADLIGYPLRLVISPRKVKDNLVELQFRRDDTKMDLNLETAVEKLVDIVKDMRQKAER